MYNNYEFHLCVIQIYVIVPSREETKNKVRIERERDRQLTGRLGIQRNTEIKLELLIKLASLS